MEIFHRDTEIFVLIDLYNCSVDRLLGTFLPKLIVSVTRNQDTAVPFPYDESGGGNDLRAIDILG